jgi:hypothetical protein
MDFKHGFVFAAISILFASCGCREDDFGRHLGIIIPMNTYPGQDTFFIGDTLWIEAEIDKNVRVRGAVNTIYLEGFDFFSELAITEISDTVANYVPDIEVVEKVGQISLLPLATVVTFPIRYEEDEYLYRFRAALVFKEMGLYKLSFNTDSSLFERYSHPSMFTCKNRRRERVDVIYENSSTSMRAYEELFLKTRVDYLLRFTTFERYRDGGAHTFVVKER